MTVLSSQKTAHALRHFNICGSLWAIYGPNATAAGAIFSGLALLMGLSEAQIAFLVSLSSLAGLWQLFSFYVTRHVHNKIRFILTVGACEITCASSIVLLYYLPQPLRFPATASLLILAYILGNSGTPIFTNWFSNVLPEEVRASFLGRRWFTITIVSMIYLYTASRWLDYMDKTHLGFLVVFAVGWIAGLLGYAVLRVTPYPELPEPESQGFARSLLSPFHNRDFRVLFLYQFSRTTSYMIAGAFYGVYMIKYLGLDYSRIAIYTNLTLFTMVLGYLASGNLTQRYGSTPITRLLILPTVAVPALWALATPQTYAYLVPVACLINGLCLSGLDIAVSNLIYKTLPGGQENSVYFANWNACLALAAALGPFAGGLMKTYLPATITVAGMEFTNLRFIFAVAALASVVPVILTAFLREGEATSPLHVLGQFRGNLLSLAYNYGLYSFARNEQTRGEAMLGLGRSRSPLAVVKLLRGLDHVSHEVRAKAAQALGEGRFPEAVEPLVHELEDKQSDIRPEAAEALGKIGAAPALLLEALDDEDPRVRASAAMALGELGSADAQGALLRALEQPFDRLVFPTLVEAASRSQDLRVLEPALAGLANLRAPIVRLQVINGICRVLGEKNHFYRLATADKLSQGRMREKMMARIERLLAHSRFGDNTHKTRLAELGQRAAAALAEDDVASFAEAALRLARLTDELPTDQWIPVYAAVAIRRYLGDLTEDVPSDEIIVFLVICLTALARGLAEPPATR